MKSKHVRYQPGLAKKICDGLAVGISLSELCAEPGMPDRHSVRAWMRAHPDFAAQYKEARLWWCEAIAEDVDDLADSAPQVAADAAAKGINENAAIQALRLQIDTKKWMLSKLVPAVYGDRVAQQVELTGKDGAPFIPPETDRSKLALALLGIIRGHETTEQLQQRLADRAEPKAPPYIDVHAPKLIEAEYAVVAPATPVTEQDVRREVWLARERERRDAMFAGEPQQTIDNPRPSWRSGWRR